jgi:UDP-GlcNAc:undecaprenyl-phosphate GlcNAc-1-phosphate transferase
VGGRIYGYIVKASDLPAFTFLSHLAFAFAIFAFSVALTYVMMRFVRLFDVPNERSSHSRPVPKSGGVGIVVTFVAACMFVYIVAGTARIDDRFFWAFLLCALALGVVSLIDDITQSSFMAKIFIQIVCVCAMLALGVTLKSLSLPVVGEVSLGPWGYALTFLWIVGLTNAYNFMDGLDGLAGGVAVIAACFMCAIAWNQNSFFVYITSYALIASVAGFLVFNFPPARIFMGDVGSAFLGFVFATLAIIGASFDYGRLSFYVVPLLFFHFIFDTLFTFSRRLYRGEKVLMAHRSHLYQLLNRMGHSHRAVSLYHYAMTMAQGIGALVLVNLQPHYRLIVFLPFLVFEICYAVWILGRAKALSLI